MEADLRARKKFWVHKADAKRRGIRFELTFDQWWAWWQEDDRWLRRGRGRGRLVMARYGDTGPYALGNIHAATHAENMAESSGQRRSDSIRIFHAARKAQGLKPNLAERGSRHPRSRPVITPEGRFESGCLAADHYGMPRSTLYDRVKRGVPGWEWDAGTDQEQGKHEENRP